MGNDHGDVYGRRHAGVDLWATTDEPKSDVWPRRGDPTESSIPESHEDDVRRAA